jgi:hypothetical protein
MIRFGNAASITRSSSTTSLIPTYTTQNSACWLPGVSTKADIPCGFDNMGSASLYFEFGPGALGFNSLYKMSWVSPLTAVLAYSSKQAAPDAPNFGALPSVVKGFDMPLVTPVSSGPAPATSGIVPGLRRTCDAHPREGQGPTGLGEG